MCCSFFSFCFCPRLMFSSTDEPKFAFGSAGHFPPNGVNGRYLQTFVVMFFFPLFFDSPVFNTSAPYLVKVTSLRSLQAYFPARSDRDIFLSFFFHLFHGLFLLANHPFRRCTVLEEWLIKQENCLVPMFLGASVVLFTPFLEPPLPLRPVLLCRLRGVLNNTGCSAEPSGSQMTFFRAKDLICCTFHSEGFVFTTQISKKAPGSPSGRSWSRAVS